MTKKSKTLKKEYLYNKTVGVWLQGPQYTPETDQHLVGIEIECEGTRLPRDLPKGWTIHEDGSLRGESAEYVFNTPASEKNWARRLDDLANTFREAGSEFRESYRTSVHVHLNAKPLLFHQVYSWIMLYVVFEDALGHIAGKERLGNLFCLRARDAEFFIESLRRAVIEDYPNVLTTDNLRYSAVNPVAIMRHGSLEFRAFRGTTDVEAIKFWTRTLLDVRTAAMKMANPAAIPAAFSDLGVDDFARSIFNVEALDQFPKGWQDSALENLRVIQHAAFARDWVADGETAASSKKTAEQPLDEWVEMAPPEPPQVRRQRIEGVINRIRLDPDGIRFVAPEPDVDRDM